MKTISQKLLRRFLWRAFDRTSMVIGVTISAAVATMAIAALTVTLPHIFAPNTPISASEINTNFATLKAAIEGVGNQQRVVKDNSGTVLGLPASININDLTLLTSTGYLLRINWQLTGNLQSLLYSGAGCTGTKYMNAQNWFGKSAIIGPDLQYYVPANVAANGTASSGTVPIQSVRYFSDVSTCHPDGGQWAAIEVRTATAAELGLPSPIALPLRLE